MRTRDNWSDWEDERYEDSAGWVNDSMYAPNGFFDWANGQVEEGHAEHMEYVGWRAETAGLLVGSAKAHAQYSSRGDRLIYVIMAGLAFGVLAAGLSLVCLVGFALHTLSFQ